MMNFNFLDLDFSNDSVVNNSAVPAGEYRVYVSAAETCVSKSMNHYIKATFTITDGPFMNRKIFVNYNMTGNETAVKIGRGALKALLLASGKGDRLNDVADLVGAEVLATVKVKTSIDFGDQNTITLVKSLA